MEKKFTREYLRDDLDLPSHEGDKDEKRTVIENEITGTRRWSTDYRLIFQLADQPKDEAWMVFYSCGSTESQDESPWEFEDQVDATLVHPVEKTVTVWAAK